MPINSCQDEKNEGVDLLYKQRTKPLHGHIISNCLFKKSGHPYLLGERIDESTQMTPCIIEVSPEFSTPVTLSGKPNKAHPTKGEKRQEPEPIFAEFANCDTSEKFLSFANKYGRLTNNRVGLPSDKDIHGFLSVPGEPLHLWQAETFRMHTALSFWLADPEYTHKKIFFISDDVNKSREIRYEMLDKKYEPVWKPTFADNEEGFVDYMASLIAEKFAPGRGPSHVLASSFDITTRHLLKHLPEGDYRVASKMIAKVITAKAMADYPSQNNLRLNDDGTVDMRIFPDDLLAFIWYSFAEVIAGQRIIRQCIHCKGLIELAEGSSRMNFHIACRDKIRKHRSRYKEKYTTMLKAGEPLTTIATACKISLDVLQYWLRLDSDSKK